jgi:hypothetical protein
MIRDQIIGLVFVAFLFGGQANGQPRTIPALPPTNLPAPAETTPELVPGVHPCPKRVYKNDRAFFQFMPGVATAYYSAWFCCPDPQACKTIVSQTYLTKLIAITIDDPHYEYWQTVDVPQTTDWKISKHPCRDCDCDDCHDDCHDHHCHDHCCRYAIYYRCGGSHWKLYGYFCKDCPK